MQLMRKIIPYRSAIKSVFQLRDFRQLRRVSLIAFQHCVPYMVIHWNINMVRFLLGLFLHQNLGSITSSLRKEYFQVQMDVICK